MDGLKKIMYGVTDFPRMRREHAYFVDREPLSRGELRKECQLCMDVEI